MVNRSRNLGIFAALVTLILAVAFEGRELLRDRDFNRALAEGNAAQLNGRVDARRQFANAYELQQQREFKAAVKAYAEIDAGSDTQLRLDIKFNLANLYFREAKQLRDAGDKDLAMPLIELAKQNYREILRADSSHWPAKYNLELALVLAPETDPVDPMNEVNPERSPRAITKMQSREPLP
jgi:mxaK protein